MSGGGKTWLGDARGFLHLRLFFEGERKKVA